MRACILNVAVLKTDSHSLSAMRMGPGKHLHGLILPGGVRGEDFDYFHEIIVVQELTRINSPGYMAGMNAGMVIGAPPLLHYATEHIRNKYLPGILASVLPFLPFFWLMVFA